MIELLFVIAWGLIGVFLLAVWYEARRYRAHQRRDTWKHRRIGRGDT